MIFLEKVDCKWGQWSTFSNCISKNDCGPGYKVSNRKREREAENGGKSCVGKDSKRQSCFSKPCLRPGKLNQSHWFVDILLK